MSDINQNVNINVNANTQDAGQDIERLERNISTLDGAINLVGGSVEVLAGSLALTGAVSEEQAAKFESMAVGAIALADGSKRIIEGYKTLATQTKVLTVVQRIYNAVMSANPVFIIVGVLAAVVTGVVALTKALKSQREEQERLNEAQAAESLIKFQERQLRLAQLRGETEVELAKRARDIAKAKNDEAQKAFLAAKGTEKEQEALDKYNAAWDDYIVAKEKVTQAEKKAAREARNAKLEYEGLMQTIKQTTEEVVESLDILNANDPLSEPLEQIEEFEEELEDMVFFTEEQLKAFNEATEILEDQSYEARRERLVAYYDDLIKQAESNSQLVQKLTSAKNKALEELDKESLDKRSKQEKFFASEQAEAIKESLSVATDLVRVFSENIDESSKEGFEKSKKYKIAETRIASLQAAFSAYGSLVGVPFVGPILAVAAAATALAAGQKAINDIQASTFEGGGSLPSGFGGSSTPNLGGASGGGGGVPQIPGFGTSGVTTLNAVVLAGDVTSAQAQDAAIRNRRRFGRGG